MINILRVKQWVRALKIAKTLIDLSFLSSEEVQRKNEDGMLKALQKVLISCGSGKKWYIGAPVLQRWYRLKKLGRDTHTQTVNVA